jgi:hypothetical protein
MKDMKTLLNEWRTYETSLLKEEAPPQEQPPQEQPPEADAGGSWPSKPTKTIAITSDSNLSSEAIMGAWKKLAALNPPKDPETVLAGIGGAKQLVANVKALEKNFAGAANNPARIDMPVVDPDKDMADLKGRLQKGQLDFKEPFVHGQNAPSKKDFPRGLDKVSDEEQEAFLTKGLKDKQPTDDSQVQLKPVPIDVAKSYPTQSAVYLDKSLWNILNFGPTDKGGVAHGKPNLIAIQDGGNNYILDGHHRWSSAWISGGPSAKIRVQALTGLDVDTAIAALRSYGNARDNAQKG